MNMPFFKLPVHSVHSSGNFMMLHTILGYGGAIGNALARELSAHQQIDVRLCARNPGQGMPGQQIVQADMADPLQAEKAIRGSDICYLTLGLPYTVKAWQQWPLIMKNIVMACNKYQSRLIFFDNIYAFSPDALNPIHENGIKQPLSIKGRIRYETEKVLLNALEKGDIQGCIAYAPDFFGAGVKTSVLMATVYDNLKKGKKPQWFCNADMPHSMGYVPEMARGTAMLGLSDIAWGDTWNLPVPAQAPTGREWIQLFAQEMQISTKGIQIISPFMNKILGLFIPILSEMQEMLYQYDRPYIFDSTKFCKAFNYQPLSNQMAVQETIKNM
jgi:nucleoside-diphosphate-sugar epimerase